MAAYSQTLRFSGYEWNVKAGKSYGPGPNRWDPAQVWVDAEGQLHLKIARTKDGWVCAEVQSKEHFGFGTFEFEVTGPIDRLDPNVILGLFTYPLVDGVELDGTNEIDIEFSRWGVPTAPAGNFTVWPARKSPRHLGTTFPFSLKEDRTTHRIIWERKSIIFESQQGQGDKRGVMIHQWAARPEDYEELIPHRPSPILMNLWLMRGQAPMDGKEIEIVIQRFRFIPAANGTKEDAKQAADARVQKAITFVPSAAAADRSSSWNGRTVYTTLSISVTSCALYRPRYCA